MHAETNIEAGSSDGCLVKFTIVPFARDTPRSLIGSREGIYRIRLIQVTSNEDLHSLWIGYALIFFPLEICYDSQD